MYICYVYILNIYLIKNMSTSSQDHWKLHTFYFLTSLWKFYMLISLITLKISGISQLLFRLYYCDRYKLIYLQILFLNALFMIIYQFLHSKTLSHMVLPVVGGSGGS